MPYSVNRKYRRPYSRSRATSPLVYVIVAITMIVSFWPGFHPETFIIPEYHWQLDVLCHAGFYFAGAILLYTVMRNRKVISVYLFSALLLLSWGLELIQHFIPGRAFTLLDMSSNTIGILLAVGTIQLKKKMSDLN